MFLWKTYAELSDIPYSLFYLVTSHQKPGHLIGNGAAKNPLNVMKSLRNCARIKQDDYEMPIDNFTSTKKLVKT